MEKKFTIVNIKYAVTFLLTAILCFDSSMAQAYAIYDSQDASEGLCLPDLDSNPAQVLQRNGIKQSGNPTSEETVALAKGLAQVEVLNGSPIPLSWRQNFNYIYGTGSWDQSESQINIRRLKGSDDATNIGHLMHELGHKVGESGVYQKYASFTVYTRCSISEYATTNLKEEFSEVFATYVVSPNSLAKKCPQAYSFMSTQLFPQTNDKVALCEDSLKSSEKVSKPDSVASENGNEQSDNNDKENTSDTSKKPGIGKYLAIAGVVGVAGVAAYMAFSKSKKDKEKSKSEDRAPASASATTTVSATVVASTTASTTDSQAVSATVTPSVVSPVVSTTEPPAVSAAAPQMISGSGAYPVSTIATPEASAAATQDTEEGQEKPDDSNNVAAQSVPPS